MNIIIESYSWYDKIFRYSHMTIALIAPAISFLDRMITGSAEQTSTVVLILGGIVAGMIKIKDYLKFDKLKDQAKQQTVKYQQLYQRIEREMRKPSQSRQNGEEFISWITRELSIIEIDDPELSQTLKNKYIDLCKSKGIPVDEDLEALSELFVHVVSNAGTGSDEKHTHTEEKTRNRVEMSAYSSTNYVPEAGLNTENTVINSNNNVSTENINNMTEVHNSNNLTSVNNLNIPTEVHNSNNPSAVNNLNNLAAINSNVGNINTGTTSRVSFRKHRSPSEESDRQEYREKIRTLDTAQDLNWALDRLGDLSDTTQ